MKELNKSFGAYLFYFIIVSSGKQERKETKMGEKKSDHYLFD